MVEKLYAFETTAGTAIVTANKASVEASLVSLNGGSITASAVAAANGATGLRFVAASGQNVIGRWPIPTPADALSFAGTFMCQGATDGSALAGTGRPMQLLTAAGVVVVNMRMSTANQPFWGDRVGNLAVASGSTLPTLVPGTKYFAQAVMDRGAGTITAEIWGWDTTNKTPTTRLCQWVKTTADMGTEPAAFVDLGNTASPYPAMTCDWDTVRVNPGATSLPGPYVPGANQAPTAAYDSPRSSAAAGAQFTITLSGSDPDGTISAYEHNIDYSSAAGVSLSGANTASATGTAPAAGNIIVFKGRVKDDQGAFSAYVTKELVVPTSDPTVFLLPVTGGGFIRNGAQATDGATLASAADTDFMETPTALSSTAQTLSGRFQPMVTRQGTLANVVRLSKNGTSGHAVVRLMQGTTVLGTSPTLTLTDAAADYEIDLTASQVDAITAAVAAGGWSTIRNEIDFTI